LHAGSPYPPPRGSGAARVSKQLSTSLDRSLRSGFFLVPVPSRSTWVGVLGAGCLSRRLHRTDEAERPLVFLIGRHLGPVGGRPHEDGVSVGCHGTLKASRARRHGRLNRWAAGGQSAMQRCRSEGLTESSSSHARTNRPCDVSGHRADMSRDIVPRSARSAVGLVVAARVQGQLTEQLSVLADHPNLQTIDEDKPSYR
jgi:hypothetical protein